jgi:hypothetical protein
MGEPFDRLAAAAAIASGWPVLEVEPSSEADLDATLATLERFFGPLPQADIVEPWDDEPFAVIVDLPGLTSDDWALLRAELPDARLVPGPRPHEREAVDLQQRGVEVLAGDVAAAMAFDLVEGGILGLDLARRSGVGDPELPALEAELADAIRSVDPSLSSISDRGPDTVTPVIWRSTGRFGFELSFPGQTPEPEVRLALVNAVASVLRARADHPTLRLAPDVRFDVRAGFSLVVFAIANAIPPLPGDGPWRSWVPVDEGLLAGAEVELNVDADHHEAGVHEIAPLAEAHGWVGGRARWVRIDGGRWRFLPVWHAPLAPTPLPDAARYVPGVALGLEDRWAVVQPLYHVGICRTIVRLRDGRSDRDWLRRVAGEPITDAHRPLIAELERMKPLVPGFAETLAAIRGIRDITGRLGAEVRLNGRAERESGFRAAMEALGQVHVDGWASVGWVGFRSEGPLVQLWRVESGPRDIAPEWSV